MFVPKIVNACAEIFYVCAENQVLYLNKPLLQYRSFEEEGNGEARCGLFDVIGQYVWIQQVVDAAKSMKFDSVVSLLPEAIYRCAQKSLERSVFHVKEKNKSSAERYFHLALAIDPSVRREVLYQQLTDYLNESISPSLWGEVDWKQPPETFSGGAMVAGTKS